MFFKEKKMCTCIKKKAQILTSSFFFKVDYERCKYTYIFFFPGSFFCAMTLFTLNKCQLKLLAHSLKQRLKINHKQALVCFSSVLLLFFIFFLSNPIEYILVQNDFRARSDAASVNEPTNATRVRSSHVIGFGYNNPPSQNPK